MKSFIQIVNIPIVAFALGYLVGILNAWSFK
jgi:hypothetical protein